MAVSAYTCFAGIGRFGKCEASLAKRLTQNALIELGVADVRARRVLTVTVSAGGRRRHGLAGIHRVDTCFLFVKFGRPNDGSVGAKGKHQAYDVGKEEHNHREPDVWLDCILIEAIVGGWDLREETSTAVMPGSVYVFFATL